MDKLTAAERTLIERASDTWAAIAMMRHSTDTERAFANLMVRTAQELITKLGGDEVFDNEKAIKAGWCLSNRDDGVYEIQRLDEAEVFPDDGAAIAFVRKAAENGDRNAQLALRLNGGRWR